MTPLIVANWKMQLDDVTSVETAARLRDTIPDGAEVVLCPPFTALALVASAITGSSLALGAQDCAWQARGALTGEVSPNDLVHLGCRYVILGHSERRQFLAESDAVIGEKIRAALAAGLQPILCVGETLEERQRGQREAVLARQLDTLRGTAFVGTQRCTIAYEPVWAIGTGHASTPEDIAHARASLWEALRDRIDATAVTHARLLYGGSVDPTNVSAFLAQEGVDGILVGTAGQTAARLRNLVAAAVRAE